MEDGRRVGFLPGRSVARRPDDPFADSFCRRHRATVLHRIRPTGRPGCGFANCCEGNRAGPHVAGGSSSGFSVGQPITFAFALTLAAAVTLAGGSCGPAARAGCSPSSSASSGPIRRRNRSGSDSGLCGRHVEL